MELLQTLALLLLLGSATMKYEEHDEQCEDDRSANTDYQTNDEILFVRWRVDPIQLNR